VTQSPSSQDGLIIGECPESTLKIWGDDSARRNHSLKSTLTNPVYPSRHQVFACVRRGRSQDSHKFFMSEWHPSVTPWIQARPAPPLNGASLFELRRNDPRCILRSRDNHPAEKGSRRRRKHASKATAVVRGTGKIGDWHPQSSRRRRARSFPIAGGRACRDRIALWATHSSPAGQAERHRTCSSWPRQLRFSLAPRCASNIQIRYERGAVF
jgi:hypothetical protein